MSELFRLEMTGVREIEQALLQLPKKLHNKVLRKALRQSGNIMLKKARDNAPVKSGLLKKSIKLRVDIRGTPAAIITVRIPSREKLALAKATTDKKQRALIRKNASKGARPYYGAFIELGTKDIAPHPYLRPAFNSTVNRAFEKFFDVLNEEINKLT